MNSRERDLRSGKNASYKNPRIVRVSRAFGGKDRHSKVCTVRGLRDRRIRLSVPNAIQLYDLQHRLGLSQPSKVIDWLLDATKHDIHNLPPLPLPLPIPIPNPQLQTPPQKLISNSPQNQNQLLPFNHSFFPNYNYFQWQWDPANFSNQTPDPPNSQYLIAPNSATPIIPNSFHYL